MSKVNDPRRCKTILVNLSLDYISDPIELTWTVICREGIEELSSDRVALKRVLAAGPHSEAEMVCVIPGRFVNATTMDKPAGSRKNVRKMLPFLIEEYLVGEPHDHHVAYSEISPTTLALAAIKRSVLDRFLNFFKEEFHVSPSLIYSDVQLLDEPDGETELYVADDRALILCKSARLDIERRHLSAYLRQLPPLENQTINVHNLVASTLPLDRDSPELGTVMERGATIHLAPNPVSMITLVSNRIMRGTSYAPNLLQGEYTPLKNESGWQRWRWLIVALLMATGLHLIIGQYMVTSLEAKTQDARDAQKALYAQLFPKQSRVIDPVKQMRIYVNQPIAPSVRQIDVMALIDKVITSVFAHPESRTMTLEALRFNASNTGVELTLITANLQSVELTRNRLQQAGLPTRISSATTENDLVRASLLINPRSETP